MKTIHNFNYPQSTQDTYTIDELINELSKYPKDMAVVGLWEGMLVQINEIAIKQCGVDSFIEDVVFIDVDNH